MRNQCSRFQSSSCEKILYSWIKLVDNLNIYIYSCYSRIIDLLNNQASNNRRFGLYSIVIHFVSCVNTREWRDSWREREREKKKEEQGIKFNFFVFSFLWFITEIAFHPWKIRANKKQSFPSAILSPSNLCTVLSILINSCRFLIRSRHSLSTGRDGKRLRVSHVSITWDTRSLNNDRAGEN